MRISWMSLAPALALTSACRKAEQADVNPVKWTVSGVTGDYRAGSTVTVHLAAAVDDGWYIYSLTQKAGGPTPMSVAVAPSPPFHLVGDVAGPRPVVVFDKGFGIETERYQGTPSFDLPVAVDSVPSTLSGGLKVNVRFQACNESFCLPARNLTLETPVQLAKP